MKLSILIPMYNAEKYIGNCLDSLINQDISKDEYEIIVMDDGSTDNCSEIVSLYKRKHKNIFLFKEANAGLYSTRNKLLSLAKGDYIYNLDADDYITNNSFATLLKYALEYDVEIIGFKTLETQSLKEFTNEEEQGENIEIIILKGLSFINNYRALRHEVWWYLIKKSFLDETGIVFDNNEYNGDTLFTLKLLLKSNKLIYYPISIHRYVQTSDSIMRSDNVEIKAKRLEYMYLMIIDYSKLINSVAYENFNSEEKALQNLKFRRDVFSFFTIIKMIQTQYSYTEFKRRIETLAEVDAYPINNFIGIEYNSIKYKLIILILNNKIILFAIILLRNFFFNFFKYLGAKKE